MIRNRAAVVPCASYDRATVREAVLGALSVASGTDNWHQHVTLAPPEESRVFVMPNHVMHRREGESERDFESKCSNSHVVSEVVATLVERGFGSVRIGNSPLQGCDYEKLMNDTGAQSCLDRRLPGERLKFEDLRAVKLVRGHFGSRKSVTRSADEDCVLVDLGSDSLLEDLYSDGDDAIEFRVGDYDPAETEWFHGRGRHVYAVHRALLESDLLVAVPKLKTHQKVGLTVALKGAVGAIGIKQCLAHHRSGGSRSGGDEYRGSSRLARLSSRLAEYCQTVTGRRGANVLLFSSKVLYRLASYMPGTYMYGAWSGNDTAWRMTLDINRILVYADSEGVLHDTPQRGFIAVVDAVVSGEGEGPLRPTAVDTGAVVGGFDWHATDVASAECMGWDPDAIPLLSLAREIERYPLVDDVGNLPMVSDTVSIPLLGRPFLASRGWKGRAEQSGVAS